MNKLYEDIIAYALTAGKRLRAKQGHIKDIGITKKYLTVEDLRIERDLAKIIKKHNPKSEIYAEEEHLAMNKAKDLWVIDPISATSGFILGMPSYGIVATHLHNDKAMFAMVYDPSMDELFTAEKGKGAFLNGKKVSISKTISVSPRIMLNLDFGNQKLTNNPLTDQIFESLKHYNLYRNRSSFAVNYCHVACGRFDGAVSFSKDSFPEYAGSLILREAGGILTNLAGSPNIKPSDRIFISGNKKIHKELYAKIKEIAK
jgi:myo-inositol-1(or 4)-monophosphatase